MTARFGIDTSILVRLATGDPENGFEHCVRKLTALIERDDAEVFASNQVIGEAYVALQHHYGVSKPDVRAALASVLKSGLVDAAERGWRVRRLGRRCWVRPARPPDCRRLSPRGSHLAYARPPDGRSPASTPSV